MRRRTIMMLMIALFITGCAKVEDYAQYGCGELLDKYNEEYIITGLKETGEKEYTGVAYTKGDMEDLFSICIGYDYPNFYYMESKEYTEEKIGEYRKELSRILTDAIEGSTVITTCRCENYSTPSKELTYKSTFDIYWITETVDAEGIREGLYRIACEYPDMRANIHIYKEGAESLEKLITEKEEICKFRPTTELDKEEIERRIT